MFCFKRGWEKAELLSALPLSSEFMFCGLCSVFYRDFPLQKWGKWLGSRKLPWQHRDPAHGATAGTHLQSQAVGEQGPRRMYTAASPAVPPRKAVAVHQSSPLPHSPASQQGGNGFPRWFMLLHSMFPYPAVVMPFYNCKTNICAGGFA